MEERAQSEAKFKSEQRVIIKRTKGILPRDRTRLYGRVSFAEWDEIREEYVYSIDLDSGDVVTAWQDELEADPSRE